MWQCCRHPIRAGWWMENGGGATMVSYGQREGEPVDVTVVPEQHLRWMDELPTMHVDRHRVYVHAGVNPDLPLDAQDPQALLWKVQGRRRPAWSRHAACRAWPSSIQGRPDYDRRPNQPRHACLAHWQAGCRSFRRRRSRRTGVPSRGSWRASRDKIEGSGKSMTPIAKLHARLQSARGNNGDGCVTTVSIVCTIKAAAVRGRFLTGNALAGFMTP